MNLCNSLCSENHIRLPNHWALHVASTVRFGWRLMRNSLATISLRMNTCKSVSKQRTLTVFRMNTYAKPRGALFMVNQDQQL
jgi:hypothetical protein